MTFWYVSYVIVFSFEVSWVHISLYFGLSIVMTLLLFKLSMEMELYFFVIFALSCCSICLIIFFKIVV